MKDFLSLLIISLFLMCSYCAHAAPVGNPNLYIPGDSPLTISMELDIVRGGDIDFRASNGVVAKMEYESVSSFFLKMEYLLNQENNLQSYLRLGLSEIDIVDETPLLDIKPYIEKFDYRENSKKGWLEKNIEKVTKAKDDGRFI